MGMLEGPSADCGLRTGSPRTSSACSHLQKTDRGLQVRTFQSTLHDCMAPHMLAEPRLLVLDSGSVTLIRRFSHLYIPDLLCRIQTSQHPRLLRKGSYRVPPSVTLSLRTHKNQLHATHMHIIAQQRERDQPSIRGGLIGLQAIAHWRGAPFAFRSAW